MITSVKIDDRTKGRLQDLQTEIESQTGHTVTQQELLERLVDSVYESRSEFIESLRDEWDELSDEDIDGLLSRTAESGDAIDDDDIDDMIYDSETE
ncbi:hypothetical protein [Natrinema halophilum]|uniref:Uncharacterized protein n=1 Tax=Natrinema halophilum TaxID=1699371 RepID=A0A7D5H8R9_9EURY|nr:hypothetical protein [Natrinema halophilum]QLG49795.1 hypothetical protein HYG82_13455 [Natrinema halophilum]